MRRHRFQYTRLFAAAGGGGGGPSFANVRCLLHFNSNLTDASTFHLAHSISIGSGGTAGYDTTPPIAGSASWKVAGRGTSHALGVTSTGTDLQPGAADFTVEARVRPTTADISNGFIVFWQASGSGVYTFQVNLNAGTGRLQWGAFDASSNLILNQIAPTGTLVAGTEYHIAFDRKGVDFRLFLNGVMIDKVTTGSVTTMFATGANIQIGGFTSGDHTELTMDGDCDEFRYVVGEAVYGSDSSFTPPSAEFPNS